MPRPHAGTPRTLRRAPLIARVCARSTLNHNKMAWENAHIQRGRYLSGILCCNNKAASFPWRCQTCALIEVRKDYYASMLDARYRMLARIQNSDSTSETSNLPTCSYFTYPITTKTNGPSSSKKSQKKDAASEPAPKAGSALSVVTQNKGPEDAASASGPQNSVFTGSKSSPGPFVTAAEHQLPSSSAMALRNIA